MSDEEGAMSDDAKATTNEDAQLAVLREIRDLDREMLAAQKAHMWILLPIFALLAIMTILGLTGFL